MRNIIAATLALSAAFAMMSLAFAGQATIAQDDPPRLLDANYHDLPQDLVDKLRANPPGRPYGLAIDENCYTYDRRWPRSDVRYCVCWGVEACRKLAHSGNCSAKLGALTWDIGVCRAETRERVIVVG